MREHNNYQQFHHFNNNPRVKLSIVIPSLADKDLLNTLKSITDTTGDKCEVIVVDDHSPHHYQIPGRRNVRLIRNQKRMGVDKSRHTGAEAATGDVLLFMDAHMRCEPGWLEAATPRLEANPRTLYNGSCLGLWEDKMDLSQIRGTYTGARLCIYNPKTNEIFEGKWQSQDDDTFVSSMMGAIYFVPRDVFFCIGGLKALYFWGSSEPYLSLKAWLSGYEVRQINTCRMGHKFRSAAPYKTQTHWMTYNKMRSIMTLMNETESKFLFSKFPSNNATTLALQKIREHKQEIEREWKFNQSILKHDLEWFCQKFPDVRHPLK